MTAEPSVDLAAKWVRPWCYPLQEAAIYTKSRYSWIEGSTKCGKTQPALSWLLEQAVLFGKTNAAYWWVAPVSSQAKIAFNRMRHNISAEFVSSINISDKEIVLANGAVLVFKSADKPDSLYGDDVYALVADEASRTKEEVLAAIRSTLTATGGMARFIGNVKGRQNWHYKGCRKAEAGQENAEYHKLTCWDAVEAGIVALKEIIDARSMLPERVFKELYEAEPSDDGGNPFGISNIDACIRSLSKKKPVCWGWDLAKSYDWTVGIALDEDGNVCRIERFQSPWRMTKERIIAATGSTPALVDSTGVGDAILEDLQANGGDNFEGFKFSSSSKQQLMEGLTVSIQKCEIGYPAGVIVEELKTFEYTYSRTGVKYEAPQGLHDDVVCALALARKKLHAPAAFVYIPD